MRVQTTPDVKPTRAMTLNTVEGDAQSLIRITKPGVYVLNADLLGVPGKCGVRIEADNVVIELCGYSLVGCEGSQDAIVVDSVAANVTVKNGTVRNWAGDAIDLSGAVGCTLTNLNVFDNKGFGLLLGTGVKLDNCAVDRNGAQGVATLAPRSR